MRKCIIQCTVLVPGTSIFGNQHNARREWALRNKHYTALTHEGAGLYVRYGLGVVLCVCVRACVCMCVSPCFVLLLGALEAPFYSTRQQ